jgi:hypothetical protein
MATQAPPPTGRKLSLTPFRMAATTFVLATCVSVIGASQLVDAPVATSRAAASTKPRPRTTAHPVSATVHGSTEGGLKTTAATIAASANPASIGAVVTYSVRISPVPDGGTVAFADSGNSISPACEYAPVDRTSGRATCRVSYDAPTTRQISAIYRGASDFAPSRQTSVIAEKVTRGHTP